ncbi:hypothetical protein GIB67_021568 [Kingdonia uniflora]|uniref:SWIM-type domain-containing protein n=1 Tax=Kingdonia uniflora TaxID=39325 RepID=A0A7J7MDI0_9MAGN|nr:hypothetical protein GIB67_021568 [Kingdonia uniflora]
MMMKLTYDRRKKAKNWNVNFGVPRAKIHIEEMKKCCNQYTPQGSDTNKWVAISKDGKKWRVDLVGKTCDCYEWQISGLPCFVVNIIWWPHTRDHIKGPNSDMLPPPLERRTGRPRKVKRRSADENTTRQQKNYGKTDRRGGRPRGFRPRNNPPTRVRVGIGVGVRVDMRNRGTPDGVARGGTARGSVAGGVARWINKGGAARVHTQASQKSTNNARGRLLRGGAARVHTQASQQSSNNARSGLTRGGAAGVHTQASQQSTNNSRSGLTRGGTLFSQPSQGMDYNANMYSNVWNPSSSPKATRYITSDEEEEEKGNVYGGADDDSNESESDTKQEEEEDNPKMDGEKKDGSGEDEGSDDDGGDGWKVGDEDEGWCA